MKKAFFVFFVTFFVFSWTFASSGDATPPADTTPQDTTQQPTTKPIKGLVILGDYYAVDETSVYVVNDTRSAWVRIPADRASFRLIAGKFARDNDEIFLMGKSIPDVDIKGFSVISGQYGYAQDDNHIYGPQGIVLEADPETYKMLTKNYAIDAGHAFYQGNIIPEANSGSFEVLNNGLYAIDDTSVFYAGRLLKNVSPIGFSVKGSRAFATDGRTFFEGLIEKGDLPYDDIKPSDSGDETLVLPPSDVIQTPTDDQTSTDTQAPSDTASPDARISFLDKIIQYKSHFTGEHLAFWILVGAGAMLLSSVLFALYAERNDEPVAVWKSILKLCIVCFVIGGISWILSRFLDQRVSLIIGCIVGGILFIYLWKVIGIIKSLLVSILTFVTTAFFVALGAIIIRSVFGNTASALEFLNQTKVELIGAIGIIGFFFGAGLIATQLKTKLFPSLVQSLVATVLSLFILGLFYGIISAHSWVVAILFSVFYAVLLWIMRFRNTKKLFAETVRIVRVAIILFLVLLIVTLVVL